MEESAPTLDRENFESGFSRELLRSELRRAWLLAIFFALIGLLSSLTVFIGARTGAEMIRSWEWLFPLSFNLVIAQYGELGPLTNPISTVIRGGGAAVMGVVLGAVAHEIKARVLSTIEAADQRREVLDLFGQQVSPEVVNKLLEQPQGLDSEQR
jgi:hypothetical protein